MSEPAAATQSVTVERDVVYPPDKVWRALTEPKLIAEWLMDNDFVPQVDHRFAFRADWGSVDCRVTVIDPQKTLAYEWNAYGLESVVTWTLAPTAGGTHITMVQTGFKPDQQQAFAGAKYGWERFFASLDRVLGTLGA